MLYSCIQESEQTAWNSISSSTGRGEHQCRTPPAPGIDRQTPGAVYRQAINVRYRRTYCSVTADGLMTVNKQLPSYSSQLCTALLQCWSNVFSYTAGRTQCSQPCLCFWRWFSQEFRIATNKRKRTSICITVVICRNSVLNFVCLHNYYVLNIKFCVANWFFSRSGRRKKLKVSAVLPTGKLSVS